MDEIALLKVEITEIQKYINKLEDQLFSKKIAVVGLSTKRREAKIKLQHLLKTEETLIESYTKENVL